MKGPESNQQTKTATRVHSWENIYSNAEGSHQAHREVAKCGRDTGLGGAEVEGQGAWWPQHDPHPTILTATSPGARAKHTNAGCDE